MLGYNFSIAGQLNKAGLDAVGLITLKGEFKSLGAAAKISGLSLSEFIDHLSQLDIDLVIPDSQTDQELDTLDSWLS